MSMFIYWLKNILITFACLSAFDSILVLLVYKIRTYNESKKENLINED